MDRLGKMKGKTVMTLLAVLFAVGMATPLYAQGDVLRRLSAEFQYFSGASGQEEAGSDVTPLDGGLGGTPTYRKTLFVPGSINVLYVTLDATSDQHQGALLLLSCNVNGVPCNPGQSDIANSPTGWITLAHHFDFNPLLTAPILGDASGGASDTHDNGLHYTWCVPSTGFNKGAMNTVEIRLGMFGPNTIFATGEPPADTTTGVQPAKVFYEAAHYFIDGNHIGGGGEGDPALLKTGDGGGGDAKGGACTLAPVPE